MTDIQSIKTRFKQLQEELNRKIAETKAEVACEAQILISGLFEDFFSKQPDVYAIAWTQYTPHWMDGDECEFSVNDINLCLSKDSVAGSAYFDGDQDLIRARSYYTGRGNDPEEVARIDSKIDAIGGMDAYERILSDFNSVKNAIGEIGNEYMEMLFGDHVSVCYTRDGVTVEEFDHD
jgi:hypothetical protein